MHRFVVAGAIFGIGSSIPLVAQADGSAPGMKYDLRIDVPVTAGGGALWIASEFLKPELAPLDCRVCDRNDDGSDRLNGVDRATRNALRWENPRAAGIASNVLGFLVTPALAFGLDAIAAVHDDHGRATGVDVLVILESTMLAADLNQAVKFAVGRERPFVHALSPSEKANTREPADNNLSFFSGHTTLTFALATSSGTVASIRDYRLAPLVWAVGLAAATTTGYLRIAADRHYLTDVLVGALAGAAIGFAVPYVTHRSTDASASPSLSSSLATPLDVTRAPPVFSFGSVF